MGKYFHEPASQPMTEDEYQKSLDKLVENCQDATQMMFILNLKKIHEAVNEIVADFKKDSENA